jgi:peptidyl-prolyl cis-trans isomerase C
MHFTRIRQAISLTTGLTLLLFSAFAIAADKKAPDEKIAAVNGVIISQGEFDRELNFFVRRAAPEGQQIPDIQLAKIRNDVLESLIDREVLFQESKKKGIEVNAGAISDQLKSIKQKYPDEAQFTKLLQDMGLTESDVETQIKRGMAIQQLINTEVAEKVKISDEESKEYYDTHPEFFKQPEQVRASHILIKVDENASEAQKTEARKKMKEVQQKLQKGEDFATLAKTYSEGPSGPGGGNLGYFRRGQMVKPFEDAAFKLKSGETSDIVETRFGYHLIKVFDKQPEKALTYAEIKNQLDEHLKKQKLEGEVDVYIDNLRKSAKIEKFL